MPFGGLLTGGLILAGGAANAFGASKAAGASRDIAEQQLAAQKETRGLALPVADQAISYAMPSSSEIQQLERQLAYMERTWTMQNAALDRDKSLVEAIDPALIEAGHQAYGILKGQEAATLGPIRTERALQRQQLTDRLRSQYGSGYESSSAGIEAMTRFDQETANVMTNAQQSTLQLLLGTSLNAKPNLSNEINQDSQTLGNMGSQYLGAYDAITKRGLTAYQSKISAIEGTNLAPYAGASSVGDLAMGQYFGGLGNSIMGVGTQMAGQTYGASLMKNFFPAPGGGGAPAGGGSPGFFNSPSYPGTGPLYGGPVATG